jgi:hypothetical protein
MTKNNSSAVKESQQEKKKIFTVESVWNDATWHSEIPDCVLSPQAYYLQ